jgi:hypothetical protein
MPALISTSNTLVLSDEPGVASETSPPPQRDTEAPTPVPSPRAPMSNKAKIGAGSTQELATWSTLGPPLDDVSFFFLLVAFYFFNPKFLYW